MKQSTPRIPNSQELEQLTQFTASRYSYSNNPVENFEEAKQLVEQAYIAVFDDYGTGGAGYLGKLMSVIWDGSPSQYEVYTWHNGQIVREAPEDM